MHSIDGDSVVIITDMRYWEEETFLPSCYSPSPVDADMKFICLICTH